MLSVNFNQKIINVRVRKALFEYYSIQQIPRSLILHAVERLGIDLDSEESEYDAYVFYQMLEEQTSHMHALVEDIKVTKDLSKVY